MADSGGASLACSVLKKSSQGLIKSMYKTWMFIVFGVVKCYLTFA